MQARVAAIKLKQLPQRYRLVGWLVVLKIYVALAIFQLYRDLKAGGNPSPALNVQFISPMCFSALVFHNSIL